MPIYQLRLQNFMAFNDTGWIELRRLNLLVGRNSSGKTVVIRALRLMKQSYLAAGNDQPLMFDTKGGVDIGSFETMLHQQELGILETPGLPSASASYGKESKEVEEMGDDEARHWSEPVTFGFRGVITTQSLPGTQQEQQVKWKMLTKVFDVNAETNKLLFEVSLSYSDHTKDTRRVRLKKFEFGTLQHETDEESNPTLGFDFLEDYVYSSLLSKTPAQLQDIFGLKNENQFLPDLDLKVGAADLRNDERTANEIIKLYWDACKQEIGKFLMSIQHIGPIRPRPERSYLITDELYRTWEQRGWKFYLDYLLGQLTSDQYDRLCKWLRIMRLGEKLAPNPLLKERVGSLRGYVELLLDERGQDNKTNKRNLLDVGYGASQIIPIIVACLKADRDALVLIEQPELHLHPEAQARIADLLIESINERIPESFDANPVQSLKRDERIEKAQELRKEAKAKGKPISRRFLVETHSEHLLLRLQLRIAETTYHKWQPDSEQSPRNKGFSIREHDFGLIFVRRDEDGSFTEWLQADEMGTLKTPSGRTPSKVFQEFFKSGYYEIVGLAETQRDLDSMKESEEDRENDENSD